MRLAAAVVDSCTPGAPGSEICGMVIDDDCDSSTDEDCGIWYRDSDGDTYGNPAVTSQACHSLRAMLPTARLQRQ